MISMKRHKRSKTKTLRRNGLLFTLSFICFALLSPVESLLTSRSLPIPRDKEKFHDIYLGDPKSSSDSANMTKVGQFDDER